MSIDHGAALERMRSAAPLVQNITNFVAMNPMANVLLAAGASPAMVHAEQEVEEFGQHIAALTINIGTLTPAWISSMMLAARTANLNGKPWVLDPVGAGATSYRTSTARDLASLKPTVIRGNASEIMALAGESLNRLITTTDRLREAAIHIIAAAKAGSDAGFRPPVQAFFALAGNDIDQATRGAAAI